MSLLVAGLRRRIVAETKVAVYPEPAVITALASDVDALPAEDGILPISLSIVPAPAGSGASRGGSGQPEGRLQAAGGVPVRTVCL